MVDIWDDGELDLGEAVGSPTASGPTQLRPIGSDATLDRVLAGTGAWRPVTVRRATTGNTYTSVPLAQSEAEDVEWVSPPPVGRWEPPMPGEIGAPSVMPLAGQSTSSRSAASALAAYTPPEFPERIQLTTFGQDLYQAASDSGAGPFLGLRAGEGYGGFVTGPLGIPIATTPLTIANFATWGREGLFALASSLLSGTGRYQQQPGAMFGEQVPGPPEEQKTILDSFLDGVNTVGDAIWAPFEAGMEWYRNANATNRGKDIRTIIQTGSAGGLLGENARAPLDWLLGGDRDTAQKIMVKAVSEGRSWEDMAAKLYDLDPAIVRAIVANPKMTDEELDGLVKGQPLSRDPAVNILLELTVQGAMLVAPGGAIKAVGAALKAPRLGMTLFNGLGRTPQTVFSVANPFRALATGATGLEKLWRINAGLTLGGWTARAGEVAIKEVAGLTGAQGVVDYMDKLLWEMPLSTNPGLNLLDGFNTHPIETLKGLRAGRIAAGTGEGRLGVDLANRRLIAGEEPIPQLTIAGEPIKVGKAGLRALASFRDVTLEDIQRTVFRPIGWTDEITNVLFGDRPISGTGDMPPFTRGDALNYLTYQALSEVRARLGDDAKALNPAVGLVEFSREWVNAHIDDAAKLLADTMTGKAKADWLRNRIQDTYWYRTGDDGSELGMIPMYGPFDPGIGALQMRNWLWASKAGAEAANEVASAMREDWTIALDPTVDPDRIAAAKAALAGYNPTAVLPTALLNRIRIAIPKIVLEEGMNPAGRRNWTPKVTRTQLEKILDGMMEKKRTADADAIREKTDARPAITPEDLAANDQAAVAAAVGMDAKLTAFMQAAAETGEMPAGSLPEALYSFVAEFDHRPVELLKRSPETTFARALRIYEDRLADASVRGGLIASLAEFRGTLDRAALGDPALRESLAAAESALRRPPKEEWLASHPTPASVYEEAVAEAVERLGAADEWLADPVHPVRVVDLDGRPTALPSGISAPDLPTLVAAIDAAKSLPQLTEAHLQILNDPNLSIFEKAGVVAPILDEIEGVFTAEQRDLLARAGAADVFREDFARVSPEIDAPTIADVRALEARAAAHWGQFDEIAAGIQGVANRLAARPGSGVASDVDDLVARAISLGTTGTVKYTRRGATIDTRKLRLQTVPVETPWHQVRLNRPERAAGIRADREQKMAHAQGELAKLAEEKARLYRGLGEENIAWGDEPVMRLPSKVKAVQAITDLRERSPGIAYRAMAREDGKGWLVFEERVRAEPIATVPDRLAADVRAAQARVERPGAYVRVRESYTTPKGVVMWAVEEVIPERPAGIERPAVAPPLTPIEEATPGAPVEPVAEAPAAVPPPVTEAPPPVEPEAPPQVVELPDGRVAEVVDTTPEGNVVVQDRLGNEPEVVAPETVLPGVAAVFPRERPLLQSITAQRDVPGGVSRDMADRLIEAAPDAELEQMRAGIVDLATQLHVAALLREKTNRPQNEPYNFHRLEETAQQIELARARRAAAAESAARPLADWQTEFESRPTAATAPGYQMGRGIGGETGPEVPVIYRALPKGPKAKKGAPVNAAPETFINPEFSPEAWLADIEARARATAASSVHSARWEAAIERLAEADRPKVVVYDYGGTKGAAKVIRWEVETNKYVMSHGRLRPVVAREGYGTGTPTFWWPLTKETLASSGAKLKKGQTLEGLLAEQGAAPVPLDTTPPPVPTGTAPDYRTAMSPAQQAAYETWAHSDRGRGVAWTEDTVFAALEGAWLAGDESTVASILRAHFLNSEVSKLATPADRELLDWFAKADAEWSAKLQAKEYPFEPHPQTSPRGREARAVEKRLEDQAFAAIKGRVDEQMQATGSLRAPKEPPAPAAPPEPPPAAPATWADVRDVAASGGGVDDVGGLLAQLEEAGTDLGAVRDAYERWVGLIEDGRVRLGKKQSSAETRKVLDEMAVTIPAAGDELVRAIDDEIARAAAPAAPNVWKSPHPYGVLWSGHGKVPEGVWDRSNASMRNVEGERFTMRAGGTVYGIFRGGRLGEPNAWTIRSAATEASGLRKGEWGEVIARPASEKEAIAWVPPEAAPAVPAVPAPAVPVGPRITTDPGVVGAEFPDGVRIELRGRSVRVMEPLEAYKEFSSRAAADRYIEKTWPGRAEELRAALKAEGEAEAARDLAELRTGKPTGFPDPYDETKTIPATFRVVELADLVSSDQPGYRAELQPRNRAGRLSSDEQIVSMGQRMATEPRASASLLMRSESGAEGTPVVSPDNQVIAGNGRMMAYRLAGEPMGAAMKEAIVARAAEFGIDPATVEAMKRPVLVREVPAEIASPELAGALNVATGGMAISDLAARVAREITPAEVARIDFGRSKDLASALGTEEGARFAKTILAKLTSREQASYLAPDGTLNRQGVDLVQAALMSKLMRDPAANRIVTEFFETSDTDVGRVRNGLLAALKPLLEAHALIEAGHRFPELAIGDALAPAVDRLINLRKSPLTAKEIADTLASPELFETADDVFARELAGVLHGARSQAEITEFFTEYAKAIERGEDPTALGMFGPPISPAKWRVANDALKVINDRRVAAAQAKGGFGLGDVEVIRPFSDPGTGDVVISEAGMSPTGVTQPPVVESAPKATIAEAVDDATARVLSQDPERVVFDDWIGNGTMPSGVPVAIRTSEPAWAALLTQLRTEGRLPVIDALNEYLLGWISERFDRADVLMIAKDAREGNVAAFLLRQELTALSGKAPKYLEDGSIEWALTDAQRAIPDVGPIVERLIRYQIEVDKPPAFEVLAPDAPLLTLKQSEAVVASPAEKAPIAPAAYEAITGIAKDTGDAEVKAAELADSLAHVVATDADSNLAAALKERATALPTAVAEGRPRTIEFHRPDVTRRLERITAREAMWQESLTTAAKERVDATAEKYAVDAGSPFADPDLANAYDRLMFTRADELTQAWAETGIVEPTLRITTLGEAIDAIQAIDAGAIGNTIDTATAAALRNELMILAENALERAGGEPSGARLARLERQRAILAKAMAHRENAPEVIESPFELPPAMADLASVLAGRIEQFNADGLDGYTGYQIGILPRRSKFDRSPLGPRIQYRDFTGEADALLDAAEVTIPGLGAMLAEGPIKTFARSFADARFSRSVMTLLDMIVGSRSEREIAAQAMDRWKQSVFRLMEQAGIKDPEQFTGAGYDLDGIVTSLHEWMQANKFANLPIHRRVATIPPEVFRREAGLLLDAKYGKGNRPKWWEVIDAAPGGLAELWRDADNRLRAKLREVNPGLADTVDRVWYESRLGKAAAARRRGLLVVYNAYRFALDARWQALEYVEPDILLAGSYGLKAWRDYRRLRGGKGGEVEMPPFFAAADRAMARKAWAWWNGQTEEIGVFANARNNAILAAMKHESPAVLEKELLRWARQDPILADTLRSFGDTPEQWLERMARDWQAWELMVKPGAWRGAEPATRFGTLKKFGVSDERARKASEQPVYPVFREIEEAIAQTHNDPRVVALYERLKEVQHDVYDDLAAMFFGQPDRSNLQRFFNSPILYWPLSYQIKATKWLARIMFDKAGGVDTGAAPAVMLTAIHDQHAERMRDDAEYRAAFENHRTLLFIAQMLLPITPFDMGVSLSPLSRLALRIGEGDEYSRNLFGVGPGYTYFTLLPRMFYEETKPGVGALAEGTPLGIVGDVGRQFLPYTIPVRPAKQSTLEAAQLAPIAGTTVQALPTEAGENPTRGQ